MWLLHVAWVSLKHSGWVSRAGILRERQRERTLDGSYVAFSDLVLEVIQRYFCCILLIKVVSKSYPNLRREKQTIPLNGEWEGSGKRIWTTALMGSFLKNTVCCRRERRRGPWEISDMSCHFQEGDHSSGSVGGKKWIHVRGMQEGWAEPSDWKDMDGKDGILKRLLCSYVNSHVDVVLYSGMGNLVWRPELGFWSFVFSGCGCDGLSWEDSKFISEHSEFEW